jgi:FtsP/CotA-like multicopper oxidase with cupredoxin domain
MGLRLLLPRVLYLNADFRGNIVGTFLSYCHIMEHEDKGMMAKIKVKA